MGYYNEYGVRKGVGEEGGEKEDDAEFIDGDTGEKIDKKKSRGSTTRGSGYGGYGGYYGGGSYTPPAPVDYFQKYSWVSGFSYKKPDYKKVLEKLKEKQKALARIGVPVKISYGLESMSRSLSGLAKVSCESVGDFEGIKEFLDKTKALGFVKLDGIDDKIMRAVVFGKEFQYEDGRTFHMTQGVLDSVEKYEKAREVMKKEKTNAKDGDPSNSYGGYGISGKHLVDLDNVQNIKEVLKNKIKLVQEKTTKIENLRSGKRINRKFVGGLSYKPLIEKVVEKRRKKKMLAIVDCSGSMGSPYGKDGKKCIAQIATEYLYGLVALDYFDISGRLSSTTTIEKIDLKHWTKSGGGEGFDELSPRLEAMGEMINEYDYIFVFSDLNIGSDELNELENICKQAKGKSVVLNFNEPYLKAAIEGSYPGLNIVTVNSDNQMINGIINYV